MSVQVQLAPDRPYRILVRGVNWLGDAVMTMPALVRLRETFTQSHIAIFTPDKLAELWTRHPAVNEVITFKRGEGLFAAAAKLRTAQFDIAIVLPNSARSALEPWLAKIPVRIGYARTARNLFLTVPVPPRPDSGTTRKLPVRKIKRLARSTTAPPAPKTVPPTVHQMHDYLHLMSCLGVSPEPIAPQLPVTETEKETFWKHYLAQPGAARPPILNVAGIAPGAEYGPAKRWPADRFVAAANEVSARTGCKWLIFGGAAEAKLASKTAAAIPGALNLCGRTSLAQLIAGLALCRVLLANDSGAAHVAAAVGTPVVIPFGSTSPELTGPGLPGDKRHRLLKAAVACAPCFRRNCPIDHRCMKSISVEQVVEAILAAGFGRASR